MTFKSALFYNLLTITFFVLVGLTDYLFTNETDVCFMFLMFATPFIIMLPMCDKTK